MPNLIPGWNLLLTGLRFSVVVLPEGTGSGGGPPRRGRGGILFLAAVGVLVGGLIFGSLTTPEPAAIEETSSSTTTAPLEKPVDLENFTIDQIAVGVPLEWTKATEVAESYVHALVEHQGWVYLFGSYQSLWDGDGQGLRAWRSLDGAGWESLGQVIGPPHLIVNVSSTAQGLLALEAGRSGDPARVWLSEDGILWTPSDLPIAESGYQVITWPMAAGATDRLLVVAASDQFDIGRLFEERLSELTGSPLDLSKLGVNWDLLPDDIRFTIWGPLGIMIYQATGTELGLTEEERERIRTGMTPEATVRVLSNWDDTGWQDGTIEVSWIDSINPAPDGALVVLGYGSYGPRTWSSHDGLTWEETGPPEGPYQITPWGDRLIGVADNGRPETMVSADGENWEATGLVDHFPLGLGWGPNHLSAGAGGIALTVEAWLGSPAFSGSTQPLEMARNGHVFTFDLNNAVIRLDEADTSLTWSQSSPWIEGDLFARTITLLDPETGEAMATFELDELTELEQRYWSPIREPQHHVAFVFSPDGSNWTIQDTSSVFGETAWISDLEVTESRVIAVVANGDGYPEASGFEIWTAAIP